MSKPAKQAAKQTKQAAATQTRPAARAKPAVSAGAGQKPRTTGDISPTYDDIAMAAYYRAQDRGFTPGAEMDDWLQAEQEISAAGAGERGEMKD